MDAKEFATIVAYMESTYKNFNISDNNTALEVWFDCLQDLDYVDCKLAMKKIAMTSKFQPTIAEIRKAVADKYFPVLSNTEAWEEVTEAMRKYGSWDPIGALASFSDTTKRTVDSFGWDRLCHAENIDVVRGQFLKMYDSLSERKKQDRLLSPDLLALTQNTLKGIE